MTRFRLPTVKELATLACGSDRQPDPFGETGVFLSGTAYVADQEEDMAWVVSFNPTLIDLSATDQAWRVRLLADVPINESFRGTHGARLVDAGDGTHWDRQTGLCWKSQPEPEAMTWTAAMARFGVVSQVSPPSPGRAARVVPVAPTPARAENIDIDTFFGTVGAAPALGLQS